MRTIRIWLLVLLAVLLPVRGAVAAAMLCAPASQNGPETVVMTGSGMDHHAMVGAEHASHEHGDHQMEQAEKSADAPASSGHHDGSGKCNLCCDFCSMTPLLSTLPSLPTPPNLPSVSFPDLSAPAPSFLSDGQERPPRSI